MLPRETKLAMFPAGRTVRCKWPFRPIHLPPLTIAHIGVLEILNVGILGNFIDDAKALMVAWIISLPPSKLARVAGGDMSGAEKYCRRFSGHIKELSIAVNGLVAEAFLPFVPAKGDDSAISDGLPHGFGWPLEIAEALSSRYKMSFSDALNTPMATALALIAANRHNAGGVSGGPDYYDRIRLERWRKIGLIGGKKEAHNG